MVRGQQPNLHIIHELVRNEARLIQWLMSVNLLRRAQRCCKCNKRMVLTNKLRKDRRMPTVKYMWYCVCRKEMSIRKGSIFSQARNVPLSMFVKFFHLWANNIDEKFVGNMSAKTRRKLSRLCSSVVLKSLFSHPLSFEQGTFAVDESLFARRKNHQGRIVKQRWVFGMVNMAEPTKAMFFYVPARTSDILMGLICKYIPAGSTIVSDMWRGYHQVGNYNNYLHLTVNHTRNFVDPYTGAHTNHIEGAWSHAKKFVRPKRPQNNVHLQLVLYRYMWLKWRAEPWCGGPFARLVTDIVNYY